MVSPEYTEETLRPYAVRGSFDSHYPISFQPGVGIVDNASGQNISQSLPFAQSKRGISSLSFSNLSSRRNVGLGAFESKGATVAVSQGSFGKSLNDIEWRELFDWNTLKDVLIGLGKRFLQGWVQCTVNQPFDIVKVLLQIGSFRTVNDSKLTQKRRSISSVNELEMSSDSDSDIEGESRNAYFSSYQESPSKLRESRIEKTKSRRLSTSSRPGETTVLEAPKKDVSIMIQPVTLNTFDMVNALLAKEGPRGIFKAVNTSFLLKTLHYTIEAWISGFISGLVGIPDPLFVEMMHSPNINISLAISVISNTFSSMLLTQISLIRTKFIITTSSRGCRSFRDILASMNGIEIFSVPRTLFFPALFTGLVRSLTFHYPDYLLSLFRINKYNDPYVYNSFSLLFKMAGVLIRLPFETLNTRAQVNYLLTDADELPPIMRVDPQDMCIEFGGYYGYFSTLYYIIVGSRHLNYDGTSLEVDIEDENNMGLQAIFRGWKVSLIRLISSFTLSLLREEQYMINEEKF